MRGTRVGRVLLAAALVGGSASCGRPDGVRPGSTVSTARPRDDSGPVRTDLAPLTARFAALGAPVAARWKGGVVGDPRVPGPSLYWIEAVVAVTPEVADGLAAGTAPADPPRLVESLAVGLPPGPWAGSDGLDRTLSGAGFASEVRLDPATRTVALRALGEG